MNVRPRSRKRSVILRIMPDGSFRAADYASANALRARKFKVGDELSAELKKARNPSAWRRAHALATALIENTDDFAHYTDSHKVLKRLQMETGIGCDLILFKIAGAGLIEQRVPLSMAFETMDDGEFQQIFTEFCNHVIKTYWPGFDQNQIERVSGLVGLAA